MAPRPVHGGSATLANAVCGQSQHASGVRLREGQKATRATSLLFESGLWPVVHAELMKGH